jgi:hypothetical protein
MELEFSTEEYQKLPPIKFFHIKSSFLVIYQCGKLKKIDNLRLDKYFF